MGLCPQPARQWPSSRQHQYRHLGSLLITPLQLRGLLACLPLLSRRFQCVPLLPVRRPTKEQLPFMARGLPKLLGVVGAGQMGAGIAQVAATCGLQVRTAGSSGALLPAPRLHGSANVNALLAFPGCPGARRFLSRDCPALLCAVPAPNEPWGARWCWSTGRPPSWSGPPRACGPRWCDWPPRDACRTAPTPTPFWHGCSQPLSWRWVREMGRGGEREPKSLRVSTNLCGSSNRCGPAWQPAPCRTAAHAPLSASPA